MIKGTFLISQLLSLLLIVFYIYRKNRDKIALWAFLYFFYLGVLAISFKLLFPDITIPSPTLEYTIALIMAGIPFIIVIVLIAVKAEKDRVKTAENINSIFTINKSNLIFWGCIILLNLIGFLLEKGR